MLQDKISESSRLFVQMSYALYFTDPILRTCDQYDPILHRCE